MLQPLIVKHDRQELCFFLAYTLTGVGHCRIKIDTITFIQDPQFNKQVQHLGYYHILSGYEQTLYTAKQ